MPRTQRQQEDKAPPRQVRYIGMANARMITAQEWGQVGITCDTGSVWSAENRYMLPEDQFNPEQLLFLEQDSEFVFRDSDNDNREERMRLLQRSLSAQSQRVASDLDHVKGNWANSPQGVVYEGPAEPPADLVNPDLETEE